MRKLYPCDCGWIQHNLVVEVDRFEDRVELCIANPPDMGFAARIKMAWSILKYGDVVFSGVLLDFATAIELASDLKEMGTEGISDYMQRIKE